MRTHRTEVIRLLEKQIGNLEEVQEINGAADEVAANWIKPLEAGGKKETNGLIYGLVQSGKTGVLSVCGAVGADEGYRCIVVLTSDIDPLYEQTHARIEEAFPGIDIIGKNDIRDLQSFLQRIRTGTTAIVVTKNARILGTLIDNFKQGNVRGLSCLLIDDEADQASLNTKTAKNNGSKSAINDCIAQLRLFFVRNTYLQVTATPQALFLQTPNHDFRPKFTVLSHPGKGYVGGKDFFGGNADLVREFDLGDLGALALGNQPAPTLAAPKSLLLALDTFMIAATFKRTHEPDQNCAFLCHVSTKTSDHKHIEGILRKYKSDIAAGVASGNPALLGRLKGAYDDLAATDSRLAVVGFDSLVEAIGFFSPGINVKLVNGQTDEDVAVRQPYNLFVGGNKLGRGVTIKNLLVSYYGRNPKSPQADTVLQHARMYGYRRKDIGLLRLFLPKELHILFKAIYEMERGLRELIGRSPGEEFRGVYLEGNLAPTRKNVLLPGALGVYTGGGNYNPAQVLRDVTVEAPTKAIDAVLANVANKSFAEMSIDQVTILIKDTRPDPSASEHVWDPQAVAESVVQFGKMRGQSTAYVYVDRDRGLDATRRESQGVLTGGELTQVPDDKVAIFMLRTKAEGERRATWWPQVRFPSGQYAFAFNI